MAARDPVKTMASIIRSTLNGHPEVNKRRDKQALLVSGKHKACKPHHLWPTRLLLYSDNCKNFPREMREAPHLLEYTMAANHGLLEEDGVF